MIVVIVLEATKSLVSYFRRTKGQRVKYTDTNKYIQDWLCPLANFVFPFRRMEECVFSLMVTGSLFLVWAGLGELGVLQE